MNPTRRDGTAFLALLLLAACVKYVPAPLDPDVGARAFAGRTLGDSLLRAVARPGTPADAPWDPGELAMVAWYLRPELEVSRRAWQVARAGEVTAGQRPQPGVGVSGMRSDAGPFESPWGGILALTIPIELGGKRGARLQAARARSAVAELAARQVAWDMASEVRTAALTSIQRDSNTAAWERRVALSRQLEAQARRRYESGSAGHSVVEEASVTAMLAAREYEAARAAAIGARAALARQLGLRAAALDAVPLADGNERGCEWPGIVTLDSLRVLALTRRYDMGQALASYLVAEGDLRVAVANQYPDLQIIPGLGWEQGLQRWILGLALPDVLLNRNKGPIGEAIARRAEAAAVVDAVQQHILLEVEVAVAECGAAREAHAAAERLVDAVQVRAHSVRGAFERGETGQGEGLALALAVADAEAGVQRTALDLAIVGAHLGQASGLWSRDVGTMLPDALTWPTAVPAPTGGDE